MDKLKAYLHKNATNRSKARDVGQSTGETPRDDKLKVANISEIDVAYNLQYNTVALKVFYIGSKKSYKLDISVKDLPLIIDKLNGIIKDPKSIFEVEDDEFDI